MSIPLQGGCCHPPAFLLDDNPTDPYGQSSGSIIFARVAVERNIRNVVGRKTVVRFNGSTALTIFDGLNGFIRKGLTVKGDD